VRRGSRLPSDAVGERLAPLRKCGADGPEKQRFIGRESARSSRLKFYHRRRDGRRWVKACSACGEELLDIAEMRDEDRKAAVVGRARFSGEALRVFALHHQNRGLPCVGGFNDALDQRRRDRVREVAADRTRRTLRAQNGAQVQFEDIAFNDTHAPTVVREALTQDLRQTSIDFDDIEPACNARQRCSQRADPTADLEHKRIRRQRIRDALCQTRIDEKVLSEPLARPQPACGKHPLW